MATYRWEWPDAFGNWLADFASGSSFLNSSDQASLKIPVWNKYMDCLVFPEF